MTESLFFSNKGKILLFYFIIEGAQQSCEMKDYLMGNEKALTLLISQLCKS
jgi:hypothetical protein